MKYARTHSHTTLTAFPSYLSTSSTQNPATTDAASALANRHLAMDHQHYQPIWPLLEGTFDYTLNLAAELWTMIWRPDDDDPIAPVKISVGIDAVKREKLVACVGAGGTADVKEKSADT